MIPDTQTSQGFGASGLGHIPQSVVPITKSAMIQRKIQAWRTLGGTRLNGLRNNKSCIQIETCSHVVPCIICAQ